MPTALIDHGISPMLDPYVIETVRHARRRLTEDELPDLVSLLERLDAALHIGNPAIVDRIVNMAPHGPMRECLAAIARHHLPAVAGRESPGLKGTITPTGRRHPYVQLSGLVAPVGQWSSDGWEIQTIDPDCFGLVNTRRFSHEPVTLLWRHRTGTTPLGISQKWSVADDGALSGEFMVPSYPIAQQAAQLAREGGLGLSLGVRFDNAWVHPDPDDWDPRRGVTDVCTHRSATIEEVSLTPTPVFDTRVDSVW